MGLRPHDLVRLVSAEAIEAVDPPDWVAAALEGAPWVVVRRAAALEGRIAVGVRGATRTERFAALVRSEAIIARAAPEELAPGRALWREPAPHPVVVALVAIAAAMDAIGVPWGPTGGAGFEIASGRRVLTEASDLDLLVRASNTDDMPALEKVAGIVGASPVRVDMQVETAQGAVALSELFGSAGPVLLKTSHGPRLIERDDLFSRAAAC